MNTTQRTKTICVIELNLVLNNVSYCELVAVPNPPRAKIEPMRYTYLGPSGTFTESALLSVPGAVGAERIPATSVPNALERLRSGDVDAAMVPIENSVEGGVSATLDAIAASEGMRIIREVLVPIRFVLVAARSLALEDIKTVSTHSHAWAQVRQWADATIPTAEYLPGSSTAAAAVGLLDPSCAYDAAICSPALLATHPDLHVLAEDIGDNKNAVTRFVLISSTADIPEPTGADKTTLTIPLPENREGTPENRSGALLELLEQFASRGVNLSRIESRPTGRQMGSYMFSVDADGHIYEARMRDALRGLHRIAPGIKYLGSYPRADRQPTVAPRIHSENSFDAAHAWVESLFPGGRPAHLKR